MRQRHSIDLLFSLSLFMVFVICAFLVLLFQINGYHHIVEKGDSSKRLQTPLAYVRTQIRAHDQQGAMELFQAQGIDGIRIIDEESSSILYIYEQDHKLKELRVLKHVAPDFALGDAMFEVKKFHVNESKKGFEIKLITLDDEVQTLHIPYQSI